MLLETKSYSCEENVDNNNHDTFKSSKGKVKNHVDNNNNQVLSHSKCDEEEDFDKHFILSKKDYGTDFNFKREIVWKNAIGFLVLHLMGVYGYYLLFTRAKLLTVLFSVVITLLTGQGVTAGSHRLWAHRSYKVRLPLKILMLILQTASGENCLWVWVRDHRQHHRYSDTDADPHNAKRGLFFSHVGWLMSRKHPLVIKLGKTIDMSDLEADPWVMFQKKYYKTLYFIFALIIPIAIAVYGWNEDLWVSFFVCYIARYIYVLNATWSVNSLAHYRGYKPYDKNLIPVDTKFVSIVSGGEGWHNFHHVFPWDYRTGEWGGGYNITQLWIDFMHSIGQVYDLKTVNDSMIRSRMDKMGDGTTYEHIHVKNLSKHL